MQRNLSTLIAALALTWLLVGPAQAKGNPDANCDNIVTVEDIALVSQRFGDEVWQHESCQPSYLKGCVDYLINAAKHYQYDYGWLEAKLGAYC